MKGPSSSTDPYRLFSDLGWLSRTLIASMLVAVVTMFAMALYGVSPGDRGTTLFLTAVLVLPITFVYDGIPQLLILTVGGLLLRGLPRSPHRYLYYPLFVAALYMVFAILARSSLVSDPSTMDIIPGLFPYDLLIDLGVSAAAGGIRYLNVRDI